MHRPQRPTRLDKRHLANHAHRAITRRLLYAAPYALIAVEREGDAVMLRLNSGGNALAVESYLRGRGYRAEFAGTNPGGYGRSVKVTVAGDPQ
jgi:hypothetical protein